MPTEFCYLHNFSELSFGPLGAGSTSAAVNGFRATTVAQLERAQAIIAHSECWFQLSGCRVYGVDIGSFGSSCQLRDAAQRLHSDCVHGS